MNDPMGMGFVAVFAVSGSVALLALQLHKRLLSNFMETIELEFGYEKNQHKKRVNCIENAKEPSKTCLERECSGFEGSMPLNRMALYKGIIQHKMLYPKKEYGVSRTRIMSHSHI